MSDSIRQQIIDAVEARMRTILTANGYQTNAGAHVFDWLDRDLADSELDAIVYRDRTREIDIGTEHNYGNRIRVEFEARTKQAGETPKRLRQILSDIGKAIGTDDTWGGLAENSEPIGDVMDVQQAEKIQGEATLTIEIEYTSDKWAF